MPSFSQMTLSELLTPGGHDCACGHNHQAGLLFCRVGRGVIGELPQALEAVGAHKPFIACDRNTKAAAWERVKAALDGANIEYVLYEFPMAHVEPDEHAVGSLTMAFDPSCDCVLAVGSGVINDCCKVLAKALGKPSLVVGTAPSMDGYASNSSSMIQNRVKVSLYNACPVAILADTEVMAQAPQRMLWAGLGDMLAKYVALCEWRITHIVNGEPYCENIAGLMRASLDKIVKSAPRLCERDPETIGAIVEGLILSGVAMSFAGNSRPASGLEHYFSHLWEMMALDRGTPYELHGIQVGVGTLLTLRVYDRLRRIKPTREQAEQFIQGFDEARWEERLRAVLGGAADAVLDAARREGKNDPARQRERVERILANWDAILRVISEELPPTAEVEALMRLVGMPMTPGDLDVNEQDSYDAFHLSRDIRDKYLTSTMLWDLGLLYDFPLDFQPA